MNEGCIIVKCDRCGSESRLMIHSVRSTSFLCPVCMENEIEYRLIKPVIQICHEPADSVHILYPYITDPVAITTN